MQLDATRSGFRPDELEFKLSTIQLNTLKNNKVVAALEYSLKNQNMITVPSNQGDTINAGSDIVFRFDKAYLASNSYLNRCKMLGDVEVTLPLNNANLSASAPSYIADGTADAGQITNGVTTRGFDLRNSALDTFVLNKFLSRREIDFSSRAVQSQSFLDPNEIDEISCLYNQDTLETLGIYPEQRRGGQGTVGGIYGAYPTLPSWYDGAQSALIAWKDNNQYLMNQAMYKRNVNGNYYYLKSNAYYDSTGVLLGGFNYTRNGQSAMTATFIGNSTYIANSNTTFTSIACPNVDLTAAGITALGTSGTQKLVFAVEEDLISDLFTNLYVDKPRYYAMNSSELNFRFSQSAVSSQFFKTASGSINATAITVALKKLSLQFSTFNLGTVQIPFFNFEVPFFLQTINQQATTLDQAGGGAHINFPVISYSTIPHYIKIDSFYVLNNPSGPSYLTNLAPTANMTLQIDQDVGSSLQQMTMEELARRTMVNLGQWHQSWNRVVRKMPLEANNIVGGSTLTTLPDNYAIALNGSFPSPVACNAPICPFFLLKVDTDIRLSPGLQAGMKERVNFTFGFDLKLTDIPSANVITKITAYTCGKYIISPTAGLLDTVEVSYSRDEWLKRINEVNALMKQQKADGTMGDFRQDYSIPESMVLGGSWFTTLASSLGPVLTGIKHLARFTHDIANATSDYHPLVSKVGNVAKATHETLARLGYGEGQGHMVASARSGKNVKYV